MKICLVNTLYPPVGAGGTETVIATTIRLLQSAGHTVVLITTQPESPLNAKWERTDSDGLRVYRFRPHNLYYYTAGGNQPVWKKILWHGIDMINPADRRTLRDILKTENPDIVHGHNLKGMSYTLPGVCAELGIPYIHTLHNYQLLHPFGTFLLTDSPPMFHPRIAARLYHWWNRRAFRSTQAVISPTRLTLRYHQQAGFFSSIPSHILPSPISLPRQDTAEFKQRPTLSLVYFGALEAHKGIVDALAAIDKLSTNEVTLDIYGEGSLGTALRNQTKAKTNVRWLGYADSKEVLGHYDALLYPSRCYETQGLAMAEALSYGTPVIAADIGGIRETIDHGVNGFLFPAGNVEALTTLLQRCMNHRSELGRLRPAALKSSRSFSTEAYATALFEIYDRTRRRDGTD